MKRKALCSFLPARFAPFVAALIAAWPQSSSASSGSWSNVGTATGATYSWELGTNWTGSIIGGGAAGDVVDFNAVFLAANTFQLDGVRTLGTLNISPNVTFGSTFSGNGTGGILVFNNGVSTAALNFLSANATPGANGINAPILLNSNLEVSSTIAGLQSLRGIISGNGGITFDSNGIHTASTVSSVGDFFLGGRNRYSGATTITEARVQTGSSLSFGTGAVTVNNGGQIYAAGGGMFNNNFSLAGQGWNESTGLLGAMRLDGPSLFNGTITLTGSAAPFVRINSHGTISALFNGKFTGVSSVATEFTATSTNTATFILNSDLNDWAGATRVGRGTAAAGTSILQIGNYNNSGVLGANTVTLDAGGILQFARSGDVSISNAIGAGAGGLRQVGLGAVTLTSNSILHTGASTVSGLHSSLVFNPGGTGGALTIGSGANYTLSNYADLEFKSSSNLNLDGVITGARGAYLVKSGTGSMTLSGAADNASGRVIVNDGTLVLGKASTAAIHAIGGGGDFGLVINNGSTVNLGGTGGDQIVDNAFVRINGSTLNLAGLSETIGGLSGATGTISSTGTSTFGINATQGVAGTFWVGDKNNSVLFTPDFGGTIVNGTGTVSLAKNGAGIQILSGANTYSGPTSLSAGTLSITGSTLASGAVTVTGGTLAGTGSVGNIDLSTASSVIAPGATGQDRDAVATLSGTSLTTTAGTIRLNYGSSGNDQIALTGAANLSGNTVVPVFTAAPAIGTSTIITGGAAATATGLTVTIPANSRITGGTVAAVGNNVELTLSGASAQTHAWTGGASTAWDPTATAANWTSTDTFFKNLDAVTFGNTGAGSVVIGAGGVIPSSITVNSTGNYAFTGGGISGGTGIAKSNTGDLTIGTVNTFAGDVNITGGKILLGNGAALGDATGQTFVSGGGTLDFNSTNAGAEIFNISGTGAGNVGALINSSGTGQIQAARFVRLTGDASIGGTQRWDIRTNGGGEFLDLGGYTLTKTGANQFSVVGVNVTNGNIVVNSGTMGLETTTTIQGTGSLTFNPGTTSLFWLLGNGNVTRPFIYNGNTIDSGAGGTSTINSPLTTSGTLTLVGTSAINFTGNQVESGTTNIVKTTAAAHTWAGNVSLTGTTNLSNGTLTLGGTIQGTSSGVNTVTVSGASTLGTPATPAGGGTAGNLTLGNGNYTTIAAAPSTVTINNGTLSINTRVSQNFASPISNVFYGGTNTLSIIGVEQGTTITLTGAAIGNSTQFGTLAIGGGNVTVGAGTALNLRQISMTAQNANTAGANMATLNITGGTHKLSALYLGDGSNSASIVNMSGGLLTFEQNGNASLQSGNGTGYAIGGVSGIRIGHFGNGNAPGNEFNLSGGVVDASKVTVSVGWDGGAFLNVTGGTLKARTLFLDNNGADGITNRVDLSGGGRIEIGHGGMPSDGGNTAINSGDGTWAAVEASDWTRGMSLNGSTTFETGTNRVLMSGILAGGGNLTKTGTGTLVLSGANINRGSVTVSGGMLRMGNAQALGNGNLSLGSGTTLDVSGSNGATAAIRPASISLGGTGSTGSLGSLINSSGTTGGIGTDAGGTITMSANVVSYAAGRLEIGGGTGDSTITGGTNSFTKNGQGNVVWRGSATTTLGDIILNGGTFYAENVNNNLGSTGSVYVNTGAIFSTFNASAQSKPIVLAGGALFGDTTQNYTFSGGLTLTANSLQTRGGLGDVNLTGTTLDLGGFTLTKRDRGSLTFTNNTSSGSGNLDIITGTVNLGTNSVFGDTGFVKVGGDANLNLAATASISKTIILSGGLVSDATATTRTLSVDSTGHGMVGALNAAGSIDLGALKVLGSTAYSKTAGLTIGSGNGFTANGTAGTAIGSVTLSNPAILTDNPNFTVSSNPNLTVGNDTTFARFDGTKVTGVAPTHATVASASGTSDVVMAVAAETLTANKNISGLIADQTITITGATLTLGSDLTGGGLILREAAAAGWTGTGFITSGRRDGILALTTTNGFSQTLPLGGANVGAFTAGNISNNIISPTLGAFRPVVLVKNGTGNIGTVVNQTFTGGVIINAGRINLTTANGLGLGSLVIRDGGTLLSSGAHSLSNNIDVNGVGIGEATGVLGALRLANTTSGTLTFNNFSRLHTNSGETGTVLGGILGGGGVEKTGAGNLIVRGAVGYTGPTVIGNAGPSLANGTFTAFSLANGGSASSIGSSSTAAGNLVLQSGIFSYIGGAASTDRLFTLGAALANSAGGVTTSVNIANNGYGNLAFTNTGTVATQGSNDATLTLTANHGTMNAFSPSLANPTGARLNVSVNGNGSWELNGSSYQIGGTVALSGGADLILNSAGDLTIPVLTGGTYSYLVKNGTNTVTLGGERLLTDADNVSGQAIVNSGTLILDKRGPNGYTGGAIVGAGSTGRISAIGASGVNVGDGLILNGGTVRYAPTANMDQIFDNVDIRINGGTFDLNGRTDLVDSLNGNGGKITNGMAGTLSQFGVGNGNSTPSAQNFGTLATYGGLIEDGAGQIEVVKVGAGVQELSGANTYSGKTSINGGFLRISSEGNLGANPSSYDLSHLIFAGGGLETSTNVTIDDANRGVWLEKNSGMRPDAGTNLTFATPLAGGGNLDVIGQGTVTLAASNINTGATSLYRGTLVLDYSTNNTSKLANGNTLVLRGGNLVLAGGSHAEVVSATTIDGAVGGSSNSGSTNVSRSSGASVLRLAGITRNVGGTINFGAAGIAETSTANTNGIVGGANAAYATVAGNTWAVGPATAGNGAIGGLAAGGYANNAYGTATSHVNVTTDSTFAANTTVSTLRFNGAATTLGLDTFTLNLTQQGILIGVDAAAGSSITNGTITGATLATAGTTDLIVHQHNSNPFTIGAVIANNAAGAGLNTVTLTKAGAGTLILNSANTYTGVTHINEGTLELQGTGVLGNNSAAAVWLDGTLSLNRSGTYTIANNMGGAATGVILKRDNSGIATLSGGIGTFAGNIQISQGTLISSADAFANGTVPNDANVANTVYGKIILGDANTGATDDVAYFENRGATHTIRKDIIVTNTGSSGNAIIGSTKGAFASIHEGTVQLNRATTFRADLGDRLTFRGSISGNVGTLTIDAPNTAAVGSATSSGRVTMEATNTFVGNIVVNGAILQVGTGAISDPQDQIPDASNVTLTGASATKRAGFTLSGDGETINNLNGNADSFIQSALSSSATGMRLTVNGTGTFSGVFNGSSMTLEKAGSGLFTLDGVADNVSGRVLVTSGTLSLAKTSSLSVHALGADSVISGGTLLLAGSGGDQIFDQATITMYGGTLDLGGTNETIAALYGSTGTVTNSVAGTSILTLGGNNGSSRFGGIIQNGSGTVGMTKIGNGGVVLTNANTYTGATTITGGYVQLGDGGTTGSISSTSGIVTSANTQVVFNRSNNVSFAPVISGAGGVVQNGSGVLEIPTGTVNTYTGPTVVNSGELKVNGSMLNTAITLNPGTVLSGEGSTGAIGSRGGIIRPGNSPGLLTTGSFIGDPDTTYEFELNGITAGTTHDQISTTGLIDITDGILVLTLSYTPSYGEKAFLWLNDGTDAVTGNWLGLPEGSLIPAGGGLDWVLSYNDDSANPGLSTNSGNDISLYAIPEPTNVVVLALSLGGLFLRRRRMA